MPAKDSQKRSFRRFSDVLLVLTGSASQQAILFGQCQPESQPLALKSGTADFETSTARSEDITLPLR